MLNYDSSKQTGKACSLPGLGFFPLFLNHGAAPLPSPFCTDDLFSRRMGFPVKENGGLAVEASSMVQSKKNILGACCFGQNKKLQQLFPSFESINVNKVDFLTLGDGIWKAAVPCPMHHGPNRRNLTAMAHPALPA